MFNPSHEISELIIPYANKVICAIFIGQKQRYWIRQFALSSLWANSSCTVVLSARVNCPWVTVHFALDTTVLRNIISLGMYVQTPDRHCR